MVPLVTPVTETDGGVVSRLIPVTVPVAQLPAGSQDLADVTVWFAPSADSVIGGGVVGGPGSTGAGSTLVQVMVTGALYQPLAFGCPVRRARDDRRLVVDDDRPSSVKDDVGVPVTGNRGSA